MAAQLSDDDKLAIARRMSDAARNNDSEAYAAGCAPGALTWHNFDQVEVPTAKTVKTIGWLHKAVSDLDWEEVALVATKTGYVSQTIMTGTAPGGALRVHSCVVATLDDDGLVLRMDEYLDPAQTAVLAG
jgi:hypothetical protein